MNDLTEKEFLEQYSPDKYPKPALTVDIVIFTVRDNQLQVLLIERGGHPFKGRLAIPGGFLNPREDDSIVDAAKRELQEETGVDAPYLEQLGAYGNRRRDPRDWVATVVYFALLPAHKIEPKAGSDAKSVHWISIRGEAVDRPLAFDHAEILKDAIGRLRAKLEYSPIAAYLLPEAFTLQELQHTYELIMDENFSKKAFREQVKKAGIVEALPGKMRYGQNRPAQLYRLKPYERMPLFFPRSLVRAAREE